MTLQWFGTATLMLRENGTVIVFDPFGGIPLTSSHPEREEVPHAEAFLTAHDVFVTHGHFDHILQIPSLYASTDTVIHATATPCETLLRHGISQQQLHTVAPGQTLTIGDFTLRLYQGRHCVFDLPIILQTVLQPSLWRHLPHMLRLLRWNKAYPENGEILFYEITANDKRVQIMGSMGLDDHTDYPTDADVLVLPYQGRSDLLTYGEKLVRRLRPKSVLLDHYDNSFPPMTMQVDTTAFETRMTDTLHIPCHALRQEQIYYL